MVIGDSMAEGLPAYEVLDNKNVVYTRGRRIDNMEEDIGRIIENSPKYLFLPFIIVFNKYPYYQIHHGFYP